MAVDVPVLQQPSDEADPGVDSRCGADTNPVYCEKLLGPCLAPGEMGLVEIAQDIDLILQPPLPEPAFLLEEKMQAAPRRRDRALAARLAIGGDDWWWDVRRELQAIPYAIRRSIQSRVRYQAPTKGSTHSGLPL